MKRRLQICLVVFERIAQPLQHPTQQLLPFGIVQIGVPRA
jgi:hypothetical protein